MNLKLPAHLVTFLKMMCVHLVSKQTEHSHEKYGLKKPVEIAIKKFGQRLSINFINKILLTMKVFISHQHSMRAF